MRSAGELQKALVQSPRLVAKVCVGKQALKGEHRGLLVEEKPKQARVTDSIDLDAYHHGTAPQGCRWDYLVGIGGTQAFVIAVEVHPARVNQVPVMIEKKKAAERLLKQECGRSPVSGLWHWLASGSVDMSSAGNAKHQLSEAGIAFPKSRLCIPRQL